MRILIIGNAPVERELGYMVDTFDFVVRINVFKPGHEKFIGSKTDIIAIGNPIKVDPRFDCPVWGAFPAHSYEVLYNDMEKTYGRRLVKFEHELIKRLQSELGYFYPSRFSTTGLTTIYLCSKVFSNYFPLYLLLR